MEIVVVLALPPEFHHLCAAADNRAARRTSGLHHLRAGEDRGTVGRAVDVLFAARDLRAAVGAVSADRLEAARGNRRGTGAAAKIQYLRAAADNRAARRTSGLHHLRAGEDRVAAGRAVDILLAARDLRAAVGAVSADDFKAAPWKSSWRRRCRRNPLPACRR